MSTAQYLNVSQNDLQVSATWAEDLTGYTAKLYYYPLADGVAAEVSKDATVTPGADESTTHYDFLDTEDPFAKSGWYVFSFKITKAGRTRRCRPIRRYVNVEGEGSVR